QSLLFPEAAVDVASLLEHTGRWNDIMRILVRPLAPARTRQAPGSVRQVDPQLAPVDCAEVRAAVKPVVERDVRLETAIAKAQAWDLIGQRERGLPLLAPHVWPGPRAMGG